MTIRDRAMTAMWVAAWIAGLAVVATEDVGIVLPLLFGTASVLFGIALVLAQCRRWRNEPAPERESPTAFGRALAAHPFVAAVVALSVIAVVVLVAPQPSDNSIFGGS